MTTRIVSCLVGNPYKPSFATITGKGDNPKYTSPTGQFVLPNWPGLCRFSDCPRGGRFYGNSATALHGTGNQGETETKNTAGSAIPKEGSIEGIDVCNLWLDSYRQAV